MQQYFYGKTAALVGDPDQLVSLAQFLTDIGMRVKYAVTGTPGKKFSNRIQAATGSDSIIARDASDYYYLHQLIKTEKVDVVFGNTYAKYLCRDEDIPLIRTGFPIYDRIGHQYFPIVGYRGGLRLLERILSAIMDRQDRDAPEEGFELVM
jgi:nitrogenase molybdenum-iron protein beta chain